MQQSPQCASPDARSLRLDCPEAAPWAKAAARAKPPSWLKACFVILLLLAAYLQTNTIAYAQGASCTSNDIGGVVFRDYNANGVRDAREPGLSGIVVTAYNSSNQAVLNATTTTSGDYVLPGVAAPVRLEFTGLPSYVQEGAFGNDSGTSVQFVNAATCAANFGVNNPAQYCQSNPYLATSCYARAATATANALYSFPYLAGAVDDGSGATNSTPFFTPTANKLALESQIGATWGQAWRSSTKTLYLAAFMKRHTRFGSGGPAAIYQISIDPTTGLATTAPSVFVNLDTIFPASAPVAGADLHNTADSFHDENAFDAVGKSSLGDLDLSDDGSTLFVVNLYDKRIYAIPVGDPASTRRFSAPAPALADCAAADVRPFALKVNDGRAYVGVTCSGESTAGDLSKIGLFVYSFDTNAVPAGAGDVAAPAYTEALRFIGAGTTGMGYLRFNNKTWKTWTGNFATVLAAAAGPTQIRYPMPLLTDLEFDNGDMILGIRDRLGDMIGRMAGSTNPADNTTYDGRSTGDILRACYTGANWLMESNSQSAPGCITHFGPTAGAYATTQPPGKTNFHEGPGGGEFFHDDDQNKADPSAEHPEHTVGGLAQVPGFSDVVVDGYDPYSGGANIGGIDWLNNTTGSASRVYAIFNSTTPGAFGKTNGLGDLEALCDPAPLEIGNRVWNDTNGNGIQDAGEAGIDGVTVELYRNGVIVGSTTTANGGQYYFNNTNVNQNGAFGIVPGTGAAGGASEYEVRIPNAAGASQQASLGGLNLTQALADPSAAGFLRDDNGVLSGVNAVYTIPYADLASAGNNNHSYDFGFTAAAPPPEVIDLEILKTVTPGVYTLGTNTNVTFVFTVTNHGSLDVTNANVVDNQPANVIFNSWTCAIGAAGAGSVTNACGAASGNGNIATTVTLNNGATAIFTIQATITSAATGTVINTASESLPPGPTQNPNQNLPDQSSAQVVPIVPPLSLGNQIWNDANNNGLIDNGEVGLPNVTVNLYLDSNQDGTPDGPAIATQQTNSGGYYLFTNLEPATYIVEVIPPSGYTSSTGNNSEPAPSPNANPTDNDDNCTMTGSVAHTGPVTLTVGGAPTGEPATPGIQDTTADNNANYTVDCGFFQPPTTLSLGNLVWNDVNNNGAVDSGENGLANVTVNLYLDSNQDGTPDGAAIATTQTNATGSYLFTNLNAGTYIVEVIPPAGYTSSTGNNSEPAPSPNTNLTDNDDNCTMQGSVARTGSVTLTVGGAPINEPATPGIADTTPDNNANYTVDCGFFLPTTPGLANLGDFVWQDTNQNGVQDTGEAPVAGVTVTLFSGTGTQLAVTTTDAGGLYHFTNLQPGDYSVCFTLPPGQQFTQANQGNNAASDSDANPTTGCTPKITLTAGQTDLTWDAGIIPIPAALGGCTWDDGVTNQSDGIRQPSEKLLTGVTVILRDQNGNEIGRTTTNAEGCYLFENLTPGNYVVSFLLPQGYSSFTITQSGSNGSDANPISGQTVTIKLPAGTRDLTWDAGFVRAPTGLSPGNEPQAANRIFLPLVKLAR